MYEEESDRGPVVTAGPRHASPRRTRAVLGLVTVAVALPWVLAVLGGRAGPPYDLLGVAMNWGFLGPLVGLVAIVTERIDVWRERRPLTLGQDGLSRLLLVTAIATLPIWSFLALANRFGPG